MTVHAIGPATSPLDERYVTALHEAGHAVIAYVLGSELVEEVSIIPTGDSLGHVTTRDLVPVQLLPTERRPAIAQRIMRDTITALLAARAAVELIAVGHRGDGYEQDQIDLYEFAQLLGGHHPKYAAEVGKIITEEWARAVELVARERRAIVGVADELLQVGTLDWQQFSALLEGGTWEEGDRPMLLAS